MSDGFVRVPTDDAGKRVDTEELTVGGLTVQRQRVTARGTTASTTTVNDSATSVTLKAANANRTSVSIVNTSSAILYVHKGATAAAATAWIYRLFQYEAVTIDDYTGQVSGIWATDPNDGVAIVTEVSA